MRIYSSISLPPSSRLGLLTVSFAAGPAPTATAEVVPGATEHPATTFLGAHTCSSPGRSLLALGWLLLISQAQGGLSPGQAGLC